MPPVRRVAVTGVAGALMLRSQALHIRSAFPGWDTPRRVPPSTHAEMALRRFPPTNFVR